MVMPIEEVSVDEVGAGGGVPQSDPKDGRDDPDDYVLPRTMELSRSEEDRLEDSLVWVVGSARSGTAWLGTQLLSHGTNVIDETQLGRHLGSMHSGFREEFVRNIDHFGKTPQYFFSKRYEKTWKHYLRRMILNMIHAWIPGSPERITVINEPSLSMSIDIISSCLPSSRIIFLLRDGRDVIDSMLDAFVKERRVTETPGAPATPADRRMKFITENAMLWKKGTEVMLNAYGSHREDLRYIVSHERLCLDAAAELRKIYGFLGIDASEDDLGRIAARYPFEGTPREMGGRGQFYHSTEPGRWRQSLSDQEIAAVDGIIGKTLREIGYES